MSCNVNDMKIMKWNLKWKIGESFRKALWKKTLKLNISLETAVFYFTVFGFALWASLNQVFVFITKVLFTRLFYWKRRRTQSKCPRNLSDLWAFTLSPPQVKMFNFLWTIDFCGDWQIPLFFIGCFINTWLHIYLRLTLGSGNWWRFWSVFGEFVVQSQMLMNQIKLGQFLVYDSMFFITFP